jgi:hypothetical protein
MDAPFAPGGPSYLVTNVAVNIPNGAGNSFRIVNLTAVGTPQYLSWGLASSVAVTAPIAGTPQANTLGFLGGTERTIRLPANTDGPFWWIASSATGFLVTAGDGV